MEQITREEIIGLLTVAACPASCDNGVIVRGELHSEVEQCQFCHEREQAIATLQSAEPAMIIEVSRGVQGTPVYEEVFFNESLENRRHELFTLPLSTRQVSTQTSGGDTLRLAYCPENGPQFFWWGAD